MPNISIWEGVTDTKYQENRKSMTVGEFVEEIKSGVHRAAIDKIRAESDKAKRNELKKRLTAATISGTFRERNLNGLIEHSGYICIDFDNLGDGLLAARDSLSVDAYTHCLFASASGKGLAVIVEIEPEKHEQAFLGLQKYYDETYQLVIDAGCDDVCRLRFTSYDPDAVVCKTSNVFNKYIKIEKKKYYAHIPCTKSDISRIVQQINSKKLSIVDSYEEGMRLCASLASLGEPGRDFLHVCCSNITKWPYSPEKTNKKFDNFLRTANGEITIGTFYYYAQRAGCEINKEKGNTIAKVCKDVKRLGKGVDDAIKRLAGKRVICLGDDEENREDKELVAQVYAESETGQIDGIAEIEGIVLENFPCRLNTLTNNLELWKEGKKICLVDDRLLSTAYLDTKNMVESARKNDVIDVLASRSPAYNPVLEFIEKYRYYITDGHCDGAIAALADTIITDAWATEDGFYDGAWEHLFIAKWLVGMIATAIGNQVSPLLLALVGEQNTGKTEWFRRLLPAELKEYYTEQALSVDKDAMILMSSNLLILDDELSTKGKMEERHLKELLSKHTFTARPAYGRIAKKFHRIATFCGTANQKGVVTDPTGNRRIIPIVVADIDKIAYNKIDKIAVFMEAVKFYEGKYEWRLTREDMEYLNSKTADCYTATVERELLQEHAYLLPVGMPDSQINYMNSTAIMARLKELSGVSDSKISHVRLGVELASLGYKKVSKRLHSASYPLRVYAICFHGKHADSRQI